MVGRKVVSEKVRKMQTGEGRREPEGRRLMQCYRMREGDKSEANAAGKLDTRSESREKAFDHYDTLDTRMLGAVVIGLFYTYFTPIQVVMIVEG